MNEHNLWIKVCLLVTLIEVAACGPIQATPKESDLTSPPEMQVSTAAASPTITSSVPLETVITACPPQPTDTVMVSANAKDYIGRLYSGKEFSYGNHKELPAEGILEEGGILVETPIEHVLVVMATKHGHMLWVKRVVCSNADGDLFFRVEDSILLSEWSPERRIFIHPRMMCSRPEGGEILAIGKPGTGEGKFATDLEQSWEVIWPSGKLLEIPLEGIQCYADAGMEY